MIPIIFEKNETAFNNNGIGRLRDCIECTVTEERNGVFECDFQYPVFGANFEKITCGRFVGVTHDETGDIQPFEIVGQTRPLDGIVSFHAVHLSYRQSQMTVYGSNINTIQDAFTLLGTATPSNPFVYETDIETTAYMAAADGTPRSVRQMLGGVQGSILDAYGGEYEWDRWRVILHSSRGEIRDFAVRYGVNLLDYTDDLSYQETFTSCVAFWIGQDGTKVITTATLGEEGYNGNDICVPLDLSDKFETQPSTAALQTEALAYMKRNQTNIPAQSISVNFVRLSEMGEFSAFQDLLKCSLCDTIRVIFPMYNVSANFKIVKTVWNVLRGTYDSMELGTLATTLSEALGISESLDTRPALTDYIVEEGTSGIWSYRKWNSGVAECWTKQDYTTLKATTEWGSVHYGTVASTLTFPSGLFTQTPNAQFHLISAGGRFWVTQANDMTASAVGTIYNLAPQKYEGNSAGSLNIYAVGTWK